MSLLPRHPRPALLVLLAALGSACGAPTETPRTPQAPPEARASLTTSLEAPRSCGPGIESLVVDPPALDPTSPGASMRVTVRVRTLAAFPTSPAVHAAQPLRVALYRGEMEVRTLANVPEALPGTAVLATWDGTLAGVAAPRGAYSVRVRYGCAPPGDPALGASVRVVRIGVVSVAVGDGDGARIPLLWHKLGGLARSYWLPPAERPVLVRASGQGAAALDGADGVPSALPAVDPSLTSPPMAALGEPRDTDYNLSFALRVGTHPDLVVTFGRDDGPGEGPIPRVRVRVAGAAAADEAVVTDGASASFRLDSPAAPNVGRYDLAVGVRYEVERADRSWVEFAAETVPLRAYGLLGDQTFSEDRTEPNAPWLAVVDAVARWVDGTTADPRAVAAIIVRGINERLGLVYDLRLGASAYTRYRPNGYSGARFDLTGFLDRTRGATVNCSDCASLVSTYANMVGCDLGYAILTSNFPLHYIRAIGTMTFTNDPFRRGPGRGFNYHAITTPFSSADGTDVFDATLSLDGDDAPGASPFLDTLPDGLPRPFYLSHLSPSRLTVTHDDKTLVE